MENSVSFKPVLWRLIIWRFFPLFTGAMIVNLAFMAFSQHNSRAYGMGLILGFLIGTIIGVLVYHEKYDISIHEGNISGSGGKWFLTKKTFPFADVDLSYRHKQSLIEKLFFYRTISSLSGQRIIVCDFIYGKPVTDELYGIMEQDRLQSNKS